MEGLMDNILPASAETYLQVHQEAERLQRLVDDLQDLNRVEAGVIILDIDEHSIRDLVESTKKRLIRQFDEKGVSLELNIPDGLPLVSVDRDRIGQVLINIVGNSLQYTPAGGNVLISANKQNGQVMIIVKDTGIGISSKDLPQIFTRFFRVDKSRSRAGGGSGIGLTISKHLIEAQGGNIWAESSGIGKGSKFSISLPVK